MPGPLFYRQIRKKQIDGWMDEGDASKRLLKHCFNTV